MDSGARSSWLAHPLPTPLLLILFRQKYPVWWYEWNRELLRFTSRVSVYLALLDDRYPSTDEQQSVDLELDYPDVRRDLLGYAFLLVTDRYPSRSLRPRRRAGRCRRSRYRDGARRARRVGPDVVQGAVSLSRSSTRPFASEGAELTLPAPR